MAELFTATALTSAFALSAAKKAGELSFTALFNNLSKLTDLDGSPAKPKGLEKALAAYEKQTFDRCINVKTLISRDKPIDILSIYVPLRFSQNSLEIDQYDFIDQISNKKRITVSGTGGSGKSMFMKYLWLSFFADNKGKIPIFVELKNFGEITLDEFLVFIFTSIFSKIDISSGMDFFKRMLESGRFCFILDGFDEVPDERKKTLSAQILNCSRSYPDNIFVISTRPLDIVSHWPNFHNFGVMPMNQSEALLLIDKIDFSVKVKRKFIRSIKEHLFKTHRTFLEIPLLVTIMLFVFDDIADIPTEMHLFYEQAFWTLYRRHDASKDSYERKLSCGLQMENFRNAVAAFCFFSYISGKINMTESDIIRFSEKTSIFTGLSIDSFSFKSDLVNNICFMQTDGTDYVFIHRTFQEYFAAIFVSNRPETEWLEAGLMLPSSLTENAIRILHAMNKQRFDTAIIYALICQLKLKEFTFSELVNNIYLVENKYPSVYMITTYGSKKQKSKEFFIYISYYTSKLYRLISYYCDNCISTAGPINGPISSNKYDKLDASNSEVFRSIAEEKNSFKKRAPHEDIFLSYISHLGNIEVNPEILQNDSEKTKILAKFIESHKQFDQFRARVEFICDVLKGVSDRETNKTSFSKLIGRDPIFQ